MKNLIILSLILIAACSSTSSERTDWSSGGEAQSSFQEQRYQEQVETIRKQTPEARPNF